MIARRTGLVTDPYFSATKLEWLLAQPGIAARVIPGVQRANEPMNTAVW